MSEQKQDQLKKNQKTKKQGGDDLSERFEITVPKEEIAKQIDVVASKYSADIKLPGFRKGNVPVDIIKSRYKKMITDEALNKVVEYFVYKKIQDDNMRIVSPPLIEDIDYNEGQDLKTRVKVEVFPKISLPDLSEIELKIPKKELAPVPFDEEKQIQNVLERNKRRIAVKDRPVQDGDVLTLEVQSKFTDTKRMIKKKESSYVVDKESEFEIPDLYGQVLGRQVNDEIRLKKRYPPDHSRKKWAGKELEHIIRIKNIFEMKNPEFDDKFVKSLGFDDKQGFKNKLKQEYEKYGESQREEKIQNHIIDHLTRTVEFPVPRSLVDQELQRLKNQHAPLLNTMKPEKQKEYLENLQGEVEKSVKFSLIYDAIEKEYKLDVKNDELEREYKNIAEKNNFPLGEVRKYYQNSQERDRLKESLLRVKIMNFIKEKIKIKEV